MKLTELRNLEIGTEVRLKGTNAIFEVRKIDQIDDFRPVYLRLVRSDKPVITKFYVGGDHTILYPCKPREEAWIFNNKKQMREDVGYYRSVFEKACEGYHVATVRDLEVVDVLETIEGLDEHIDPRDLISRGSSPASPAQPSFADEVAEHFSEQDGESGVLPIAAARQFVNDFNSRKVTIQLINAAIARAAQDGKQVISLEDAVNHQVSEEIKDLYRQADYHVAFETIQW